MKKSILNNLLEAYRRNLMFYEGRDKRPLGDRWLGLGNEPEYRQSISEGYMRWQFVPAPKCMGWLTLTPKGESVIKKFGEKGLTLDDFSGYNLTAQAKLGNINDL